MRASDADREGVARLVQAAAADGRLTMAECEQRLQSVYRARTLAELEPLTRDLVPAQRPAAHPDTAYLNSAPVSRALDRLGMAAGPGGHAWAVLSNVRRRGQWLVPDRFTANVLFGSATLDLRQAELSQPQLTIVANVLCGSVEIIVPDDLNTVLDGVALLGSFESTAPRVPVSGRGSVRVAGFALMGSVEVRPPTKKERRKAAGR